MQGSCHRLAPARSAAMASTGIATTRFVDPYFSGDPAGPIDTGSCLERASRIPPTRCTDRHSLWCDDARRPHIAPALMQDDRDHLARLALEMELRVDHLVEESVAAAGENRKGGLPGELSLQMIVPENDIEHGTEIELVPADIVAERRSIQRNLLGLRRKLGRAESRRAMVAVLMQDESVHRAG